jgi:putative endopeptidase
MIGAPLVGALAFGPGMARRALAAGPQVPPWGVDMKYLDRSVKPGDDFFAYANGGWLKSSEIPADRSYAGVNLELDLKNEARLKQLVADLAAKPDGQLGGEERKLRDLYDDFLDLSGIEAAGLKPVETNLGRIAALATGDDVAAMMGEPGLPAGSLFGLYIGVDNKNPNAYSVNLYQSGLGLPDRDYYLRDDKEFAAIREAYKKHLAGMLIFAGIADKEAAARAEAVYKLEHAVAEVSWPNEDRRDDDKTYNPMPVEELRKFAPHFPWQAMLGSSGIPLAANGKPRTVIVAEKSAFPKLAEIFANTPVAVWRDYLAINYLGNLSAYLPKRIDEANFAFYGRILEGNSQQLDRSTRGLHLISGTLGEALGKLYVARYFPPEAKTKALALAGNLLIAYEQDIRTLSWMSEETKRKALDKLHAITPKIGYPDKWRDYSALEIKRRDLIGNIRRLDLFEWNREMKRLDDPVDRSEWGMSPQTNNAYYNPSMNEVVFPAGILQPPFFDPNADDAVNYGEIGATIGHEISHGFDDQGCKYDGAGVMQNWWTDADRNNFDAKTAALAEQYDQYEPLPGMHINGKLTLGENIADVAGLAIAWKAYRLSLGGKPAPVLDGLTGDQRFYLAYAQSWREKWRDENLRQSLLANPHSPSAYRVNGVVRNDDNWYAAFGIKPGDKYYLPPDKRVRLW